jgi:hypothetical protein
MTGIPLNDLKTWNIKDLNTAWEVLNGQGNHQDDSGLEGFEGLVSSL